MEGNYDDNEVNGNTDVSVTVAVWTEEEKIRNREENEAGREDDLDRREVQRLRLEVNYGLRQTRWEIFGNPATPRMLLRDIEEILPRIGYIVDGISNKFEMKIALYNA